MYKMNMIRLSYFSLTLLVLLSGCNQFTQNKEEANMYVDIPAIINAQQSRLTTDNPSVLKRVQVDEKVEKMQVQNIDWEKELTLFNELDLNKAAFRGQFEEKKGRNGGVSYAAKEEDMLIRLVEIERDSVSELPIRISAIWLNKNMLYETSRKLSIEFSDNKISRYKVDTKQKLRFGKEQTLCVEGIIL